MIYFIKCCEFVKIGRAKDPAERVISLQIGNPHEVSLIGVLDAPDDEEGRLHSAFASFRHRGEWFFLSRTISDFIEDHCDAAIPNAEVIVFPVRKNSDTTRKYIRALQDIIAPGQSMTGVDIRRAMNARGLSWGRPVYDAAEALDIKIGGRNNVTESKLWRAPDEWPNVLQSSSSRVFIT